MQPKLLPFVFAESDILSALPDTILGQKLCKIPLHQERVSCAVSDVNGFKHSRTELSPARFARLLNLANGVAYGGGMGMPEWVMLDCALLPSFFAGFMGPAYLLNEQDRHVLNQGLVSIEASRSETRKQLEQALQVNEGLIQDDEWFPMAEFCALARGPLPHILGYSLYSLQRGFGILAKTLGLALWRSLGYQKQVGVAQWNNLAAVRAHLRFGRLEIIDPLISMHTKAGETFVYQLQIPSLSQLKAMLNQQIKRVEHDSSSTKEEFGQAQQWQAVDDLSWWLAQRTKTQRLFVYDVRKKESSKGSVFDDSFQFEALIGIENI